MKKKILATMLLATIITTGTGYAGLYNLTHHSRANCGNNESISWQAGHSYWLWVVSTHIGNGQNHYIVSDWAYTWRSAAVHWGEGTGGWMVEGHHWMRTTSDTRPFEIAGETVTDCSIYDGWWD